MVINMEEEKDTKFTIEKATDLLKSFIGLMKEGCVSQEVYESRRKSCEGCEFNQKRASDNSHFCGSCGCGARQLAALYIEGIPLEKDHSVRLWMPKSNCPKDFHRDEPGTGSFKPVGGRIKQLKELTIATMAEAAGMSGADDKLEYINRTVDVIESVSNEDEIEELTEVFEQTFPKESPENDYNKQETNPNENTEHPYTPPRLRPDENGAQDS